MSERAFYFTYARADYVKDGDNFKEMNSKITYGISQISEQLDVIRGIQQSLKSDDVVEQVRRSCFYFVVFSLF